MRIFLLQQLFLWVCMVVVVVLIAFLPRDLVFVSEEYETYGIATMNMQLYGERLSEYVAMIGAGSLGENRYGTSVLVDLHLYASRSLQLIGIASIIAIFIGTAKAYFDTRYKGIFARSSRKIGQGMQALPDFFIIIVVQMVVLWLFRQGFPQFSLYGNEDLSSFLFAAVLLSLFPSMYFANIVASTLESEEGSFYLIAAKGRGVKKSVLLIKHQLANALPSIIQQIPIMFMYLLSNLLMVEFLTSFRGAMYRTYQAMGFQETSLESLPNQFYIEEPVIVVYLTFFISLGFLVNIGSRVMTEIVTRRRLS
ncbi:oligopeptide transport system permease protein OppB [Geomicrobium sp. JCM 19039]|nr:oligopeptide transport system permease protein OppB [Geomicrobium sp. JCM 19039]